MNSQKTLLLTAAAAAGLGLLLTGCSTKLSPEPFDANLRLTGGQVKMVVKTGVTTQNEIFTALGSPNVVALESGKGEIWTYDQIRIRRTAQGYGAGPSSRRSSAFPTSTAMIPDTARAKPASKSAEPSTNTTSIQTATLIVRFDTSEKVASYKMLLTSF